MKIITGYNKSAIDSNSNSIVYQYNMMFDDRLVSQAVSKVLGISSRYCQDFYTRLLQYILECLAKIKTTKASSAVQRILEELSQGISNLSLIMSQPWNTQLDYQEIEDTVREVYGEGAVEDVIATIKSMGRPSGEDMSGEELDEHLNNLLKEATGDVENAADSSIADRVGYWLGTISEEIRQIAGVNEVASDVDNILDKVEEVTDANDPVETEEEEELIGCFPDHTWCFKDQICGYDTGYGCPMDVGGIGCSIDMGYGCGVDFPSCDCDSCDTCDFCSGDCDICDSCDASYCRRDFFCDTCDQCISNRSDNLCGGDYDFACDGCADDVLICDICDFNNCQIDYYCNYCNYHGLGVGANCKADYVCNICDTTDTCDGCRQNFDCYLCDWNCRADYKCNQEHPDGTVCRRDAFHDPTECLDFVTCPNDTRSCFSNTFCTGDCNVDNCDLCNLACAAVTG